MSYTPRTANDERYVNIEGDKMTGDLTIELPLDAADLTLTSNLENSIMAIQGPAKKQRAIHYRTDTSGRWTLLAESTDEAGSNSGSDFVIGSYSDAGSYLGTALKIIRANNEVQVGRLAPATPWARVSRSAQAVTSGAWTAVSTWAAYDTGGFTYSPSNIYVPRAGLWCVSARMLASAAGRLVVAYDVEGQGVYGTSANWFTDDRSYSANSVIGGTRFMWIDSFLQIWINGPASNVNTWVELAYIGGKNLL